MTITTAISTEGRVFVAQLTRDIAAHERIGANLLSPGSKYWKDAIRDIPDRISETGSPTKAGALFSTLLKPLHAAQEQGACYVNFFYSRSRSAAFELMTWEPAPHPLLGSGQEGIVVKSYCCMLRRNGSVGSGLRAILAFISWHALARIRERSSLDIFDAKGVLAGCGLVGQLMRSSPEHAGSEINYAAADILCTGVLRQHKEKRRLFFDVATALALDEVSPVKREQGTKLAWAVHEYLESTSADPDGYAESISVLPFHQQDFVSRTLAQ